MSSTAPVVLVTGATGKVGCATVRSLLSDRFQSGSLTVRAGAKEADHLKACKEKHPQLQTAVFDYDDPATYGAALLGVSTVFLLTTYTVDMLVHSKLFVDASKKAGVKHMVVSSNTITHSRLPHLGVDSPDDKPLRVAVWHRMIEVYIEEAGFETWTHLHPTFYMENLISYGGVETIRGNKIVVPYKPDAKLTWVCCDDIGACAATVLANPHAHGSKVYPLVVDAASHEEIAELLSKVMGSSQSFKVEQVDIKDWYKCQIEHGRIESAYLLGYCELVDYINKGNPLSPLNKQCVHQLAGREPISIPTWVENKLAFHIKSQQHSI